MLGTYSIIYFVYIILHNIILCARVFNVYRHWVDQRKVINN